MSDIFEQYQMEHVNREHGYTVLRNVWAISTQRKITFGAWLDIVTHNVLGMYSKYPHIHDDEYVEKELKEFIVKHCTVTSLPKQAVMVTYTSKPNVVLNLDRIEYDFQIVVSPIDYDVYIRCRNIGKNITVSNMWTPWKTSAVPKNLLR